MEQLKGSVAVVTGASKGIGRATSLHLAAAGVRVVMAATPASEEALSGLVREIRAAGGEAAWRPVDVQDPAQCAALVEWTKAEMGALHILVNCAGLGHWGSVEQTTDVQWQQTMNVNVGGVFYLSRAAIAPMREAGRGHIVNIASVLGRRGVPNMAAYCASKAAVIALSEALSREVKPCNIQVSVISPGTANTSFREQHVGRPLDPSIADPELMLQPEDVASAILWVLQSSRHLASMQVVLEPRG
ncbi:MAG: SDR family oxidoreductase [Chloroflexota bacterium]